MVTSLIEHERIHTTVPKAKALRRVAERAVTWAKQGDLPAYRKAMGFVRTKPMAQKLFKELGPRYQYRPGGYTRVVKTQPRKGDGAPMAFIEFVDRPDELRPARKCDEEYDLARGGLGMAFHRRNVRAGPPVSFRSKGGESSVTTQ